MDCDYFIVFNHQKPQDTLMVEASGRVSWVSSDELLGLSEPQHPYV